MKSQVTAQSVQAKEVLEIVGDKGTVQSLKAGEANLVKVKTGEKYRIVKKLGGKEVTVDDVVATKSDEMLQLQYGDGTHVIFEGFYQENSSEVELPANDGGIHTITSIGEMGSTDGNALVYAHGDQHLLMSMTQENNALQVAVARQMSLSNLSKYAEVANGMATDAVAASAGVGTTAAAGTAGVTVGGMSTMAMVGLGALAVGGIAIAAGSGGGDSTPAAPSDTTPPVAPTIALAADTGTSASDGITNTATVNVTGLESGATWQYQIDGGAWTAGSGTSFTASTGAHTYAVRQTDAAGNVSTLSNSLNVTLDTTAPTPVSMSASGTTVAVTFSEAMDSAHLPTGAFTVLINNVAATVASVSVSGAVVTLTISPALVTGNSVQVAYADPTANTDDTLAVQDTAGNDAASFLSGVVADGYVRGAEVWIDVDNSGTVDPGVDYFVGTTDSLGNFFIPDSAPSGSIIATGGVNIDTGVPNTMPLRAPEGSTVINPLTTLVQAVFESSSGTTVAEASATVAAAFGLTGVSDLTTYDPISEGNVAAQQAAATVATIISLATAGSTDAVATATTETIISNLVTGIQTSTTTATVLDLADSTTLANVVSGVTLTDTVESAIADASTAIQTATSLDDIITAQSVALDTVGVGASTLTVAATTNDTTPTVHVSLSTTATDGTAAIVGDTVILFADGFQVGTATLGTADIAAGYINITAAELSEGAHEISAVVIDQAGNMGVPYPVKTITVDTIPPAPSAINVVATDDIINALEAAAGVTLTGVTVEGSTVTVNGNPAVVSGTTWSYVLDSASIAAMLEGSETITVIATDSANNSVTSTKTIMIDTLAPTGLTINTVSGNDAINATEKAAGTAITGMAEAGAIVTLSVGGNKYKITADASGNWSHTLAAIDYTAMAEGPETITATATDTAGNSSVAVPHTITIDTVAPLLASFALATASDSGTLSDGKSNVAAPTFTVTAEAGSALEMKIATGSFTSVGTGTGSTQTITAPTMTEGLNVVVLRATDAAGNVTERTLNYTLDTTAPAAPVMLSISPDSGAVSNDGITNVNSGVATGTAEANSTVNIMINGIAMPAVTADASGNWSMPYTNLQDGTYTVIATASDAAGNVSAPSTPVTMIVDTTIAAPTVTLAKDTGTATDQITSDASLTLSSPAVDVTRTYTVDGATATNVYTAPTTDGSHTVVVTDIDTAGNIAMESLTFTLDTVAPTATIFLSDLTITKGETATVTVTFSEVPSSFDPAVDLTVVGGTLGDGGFDASGKVWTATFTPFDNLQVAGSPVGLAASAWSDTAGNVPASNAWSQDASIDTHNPTAMITMSDSALKIGDTSLVTIAFDEVVANFANEDVMVANGTLGTLMSTDGGMTWTATFTPTADTEDTSNVITLADTYTDIRGNIGTAATSANYTIDTAIATPTVVLTTDSGLATDAISNDASLTLSTPAGDVTRTFTIDGGTAASSYVAPTADGSHTVVVTDTDTAGNISTASLTFTLDQTVSSAPVTITGADDNVPSTSTVNIVDGTTTNDNTPVLKGTIGTPLGTDEVVAVYEGTTRLGEATLNGTDWSFATASLINGTHSFTARIEDAAGNAGTSSAPYGFSIDATVPVALAIITSTVMSTNDTTPMINGALSAPLIAGEVVKVYEGTAYLGDATATDLTWSFTPAAPLAESTHIFTATVENAGGNQSQMSAAYTLAIDITPPAITIDDVSDGNVLNAAEVSTGGPITGTTDAEDGRIVSVSVDGMILGTAVVASGAWSFDVSPSMTGMLTDGNHTVAASVSDLAGNLATANKTFSVDTAAPTGTISNATVDNILNAAENVPGNKTVSGTSNAEAGSTVIVKIDGNQKGTTTVNADGTWSLTYTTTGSLTDGEHIRSAEITDAAGNVGIVSKTFTVDTVAPAVATLNPMVTADNDISGTYTAGDTITLRFSESVNTGALVLSDLLLSAGTWGTTSTLQSFDSTSVTIQLGSDAVVAQGDTVTIAQASIVDTAGNTALADLVYTLPVPADTTPPAMINFWYNDMTNQVYLDLYSLETGAIWEYQINGGAWTTGEGNSFIVSETNGTYTVAVRQVDAAGNNSAVKTDTVTVGDNYTISNATLTAAQMDIAFPSGMTFTDGYVTILFTSATTGTITEPNGAVHVLSLINGAASATVDGVTYTYKMVASDGDMMVLAQTDTDLTAEMNGQVQGPPPVWTLISTAATADTLPANGTMTFYTTDTDDFGDRGGNDWTRIAFDFGTNTLQGFAIDGTAFAPETFTVAGNQIIINEPSGNYDATITQIGMANGFYAFTEDYTETRTWGTNSANGSSDMSGFLSSRIDYLWVENGFDFNKNGTTDDYGRVIRDIDGNVIAFEERYGGIIDTVSATLAANALTLNWGGSTETYSVDDNVLLNDTSDNEINVVETGTNVFALATADPFSYTYAVDGDTTPPTITSAEVVGSQLKLTFSEWMDMGSNLSFGLMSVMVNGTMPVAVTSTYPQGNNSVMLSLDSSTPISAGDTVTISYTDPLGNNANVVQDMYGNDLGTVTNIIVTNQTGLPAIYLGTSPISGSMEGTGVNSVMVFQVMRNGSDLSGTTTVNWAVSAGTADATDFVGGILPGGTVVFAAGETVQTISIPVVGDWIPEKNESFTVSLSNVTNGYLVNSSTWVQITNDDLIPDALILGATMTATETDIAAFPDATFTDGYVTMVLNSNGTGTITEPNGATHTIALSAGIATVTIAATATTPEQTYSYKLLTSSADDLVLAQTDLDLTVEMNGEVQGPPPVWTLINTTAMADAIPTTGTLTLYDTATDNYGDLNGNSDVKITFDFDNQTAQHYAIDGTPTFLEHFSVFNNTMIFDDGNMKSYVTLMANSAGYYTFKESYIENQNWGTGSAGYYDVGTSTYVNVATIEEYLAGTGDILWSENGTDYNGNGMMYDYGMVTRTAGIVDGFESYTSNVADHSVQTLDFTAVATLGANALVIDEGDRTSTYSVTSTDAAVLTDNAISVVSTGTEVFTFSQTNPFSVSYLYEMDMGYGNVGVGVHDGMALNVATDLSYVNTLYCINSVTDTAANTVTISIADVLAQGVLTDLTPLDPTDNSFVHAVGINAGNEDTLHMGAGWTDTTQDVVIKDIVYSVYMDTAMTAQLYVSNSITPVI